MPFLQVWGVVPGRIQAEITVHNLLTVGSSTFLHVGFVHLLGNMWFLYVFGDAVEDPSRLIEQFVTHHERRARQVRDALASGEALCAHEIARTLFPRLTGARIAQAMIEVIGHLDCLEAEHLVRCDGTGGVLRYALD